MTNRTYLLVIALILVPALLHGGTAPDDERGWWFSERFQGTSNSAGLVLKANSTTGYAFNDHVQVYSGLPVYFTRESTSSTASGTPTFVNGIGNAFTGLLINASNESLKYSSDLVVTAPTGDRSRGFSTGHVTADWTNTFSHPFSAFTPYGSIGAANTVSDTEFFVRPFTTKGAVLHFEGGGLFKIAAHANVGASAYGLHATGEQQIVSKVVHVPTVQTTQQPSSQKSGVAGGGATASGQGNSNKTVFETTHETITTADALDDHGLSTWLSVRSNSMMDVQIGFSRSMGYQLNSFFFGVGFRSGH